MAEDNGPSQTERVVLQNQALMRETRQANQNNRTLTEEIASDYGVSESDVQFTQGDGQNARVVVNNPQKTPTPQSTEADTFFETNSDGDLVVDAPSGDLQGTNSGDGVRGQETVHPDANRQQTDGSPSAVQDRLTSGGFLTDEQEQDVVNALESFTKADEAAEWVRNQPTQDSLLARGGKAATAATFELFNPGFYVEEGETLAEAGTSLPREAILNPEATKNVGEAYGSAVAEYAQENPARFLGSMAPGAIVGGPGSVNTALRVARAAKSKAPGLPDGRINIDGAQVDASRMGPGSGTFKEFIRDTRGAQQMGRQRGSGGDSGSSTGRTDSDLPGQIAGTNPDVGEGSRLPDAPGDSNIDSQTPGKTWTRGGKQSRRGGKNKPADSEPTTSDDFADKPDDWQDAKTDPQTGKSVDADTTPTGLDDVLGAGIGLGAVGEGNVGGQTPTPDDDITGSNDDETGGDGTKPPGTTPGQDSGGSGDGGGDGGSDTGPVPPWERGEDIEETGTGPTPPWEKAQDPQAKVDDDGPTGKDRSIERATVGDVISRQSQAERREVDFGQPGQLDPSDATPDRKTLSQGKEADMLKEAQRQELSEGTDTTPEGRTRQDPDLDVTAVEITGPDQKQPPKLKPPAERIGPKPGLDPTPPVKPPDPENTPDPDGPRRPPRPRPPDLPEIDGDLDQKTKRKSGSTKSDVFENPALSPDEVTDFDPLEDL